MFYRKRIEALEKTQEQDKCDHGFESLNIESYGTGLLVRGKCWRCDFEIKIPIHNKSWTTAHNKLAIEFIDRQKNG